MTGRAVVALMIAAAAFAQQRSAAEDLDKARKLLLDWGGLIRYGSENTELKSPPVAVFLGDEVVEHWGDDETFFPGKQFLNRGIAMQTTPQMLVRFRQDVIDVKPKVVVIQASSNDLVGYGGAITEKMAVDNVKTMAELARAHGIAVVIASVTPVCDCFGSVIALRPQGRIIGLNGLLKEYAAETKSVYLDYYGALAQGRNLRKEFTADGLVPNRDGYAVMTPLAEKAVTDALAQRGN